MHCGKTADRTRKPFGIIGRTGPGMRQVVRFGDRSTGRGSFGARHCNQWGLTLAATRPSSQITLGRLVIIIIFYGAYNTAVNKSNVVGTVTSLVTHSVLQCLTAEVIATSTLRLIHGCDLSRVHRLSQVLLHLTECKSSENLIFPEFYTSIFFFQIC